MSALLTLACPAHPFAGNPSNPFTLATATWPSLFVHTSVCTWQYAAHATLFLPTPLDVAHCRPEDEGSRFLLSRILDRIPWSYRGFLHVTSEICRINTPHRTTATSLHIASSLLLVHRRIVLDTVQFIVQYSRHVWYYGHSWSPKFRPFVTGSDESGCELVAGESASPHSHSTANVTRSSVKLSFMKRGWLFPCFVEWRSP